jgi:ubiquinone/menaquinone biosynthesis C-methylase UbiE
MSWTAPSVIPNFEALAAAWLAEAEVSLRLGNADHLAVSFFFDNDAEFRDFLEATQLPSEVWQHEVVMRERFSLLERFWVKLEYRDGRVAGYSQYFQLDPHSRYPISSLRVFLRSHGVTDVRWLEAALRPALERDDTVWGLVLKPGGDGRLQPRLSCTVPRVALEATLALLEDAGLLGAGQRDGYLAWNARLSGSARAFVSFDPLVPGGVALDFERVPGEQVCAAWDGLGVNWSATRSLPYLKCRLLPEAAAPEWTAYLRLSSLETHLARGTAPDLSHVRDYYDSTTASVLEHIGATYQAGLLKTPPKASLAERAADTNRWIATRAGLEPGMRVLDAGCGALGPAVDIARAVTDLEIEGVTVSAAQATEGERVVHQAGLEGRVRVHVGDYHVLPFEDASFDAVLFLESAGYSPDPLRAFLEARRVLRPGGRLYIKDVFAPEGALEDDVVDELEAFNRTYAFRTRTISESLEALRAAGFEDTRTERLESVLDSSAFNRAMFEPQARNAGHLLAGNTVRSGRLNAFGRRHHRRFRHLELIFADLLGFKPAR